MTDLMAEISLCLLYVMTIPLFIILSPLWLPIYIFRKIRGYK